MKAFDLHCEYSYPTSSLSRPLVSLETDHPIHPEYCVLVTFSRYLQWGVSDLTSRYPNKKSNKASIKCSKTSYQFRACSEPEFEGSYRRSEITFAIPEVYLQVCSWLSKELQVSRKTIIFPSNSFIWPDFSKFKQSRV